MVAVNNTSLGLTAPGNTKYKQKPIGSVFVDTPTQNLSARGINPSPMTVTTGAVATPAPLTNNITTMSPKDGPSRPGININEAAPAPTQRPALSDSFAGMRNTLGNVPSLQYKPAASSVSSVFANQQPIKGLGAEYFNSAREAMKENLRKEMFGPLGLAQSTASQEVAAGRAGSGVGKRVMEQTVTQPFASGLQDIDTQILMKQMEESARVEEANQKQQQFQQEVLSQVYQSDSANALEAAKANTTLATRFAEIAADMAKYEQGQISEEEMFGRKMEFDSLIAETEAYNAAQQAQWETSQAALSVDTWLPDQINAWKTSGMSFEDVRDMLVPMMKAGGGVNYQQIYNHLENAYGRPATANVKEFKY